MTEDYFVQIKDSEDVRRKLLGSSKQIIQVLQRYERIKELRANKLEKMSHLRKVNKEINLLIVKLKKEMPKAEMRIKPSTRKKEKEEPEMRGNELKELERELKMIEDKIGTMS